MLYTPQTKKALRLCFEAHAGQVDKSGIPYVNHPLHLAEAMHGEDEVCAALLHDVMEDCGRTPDDLRAAGMSERVVRALTLLTHERGVAYLDYVRRLACDEVARAVKVADLRHNSELSRLDVVRDEDVRRLRTYMEARVVLGDMATELATPAGPVRVLVNGKPCPFAARSEPGAGVADDAARAFCLEVETLAMRVGDKVAVVCGDVPRAGGRACTEDGWEVVIDHGEGRADVGGGTCCYRLDVSRDVYEIVEDPVACRYFPRDHRIGVRVAWRRIAG